MKHDRIVSEEARDRRAYSRLDVKAFDDESRTIRGIASTPSVDRVGDIVVPEGAQFETPMPLLLDHDSRFQVGHVTFAKPSKSGIPFEAKIVRVEEDGEVKDLTDKAWHLAKYKLRSFVSIGFRALDGGVEILKSGGLKFNAWEWLELSMVSIPANSDAVINEAKSLDEALLHVKSIDIEQRAAHGRSKNPAPQGSPKPVIRRTKMAKKSLAEQISDWEATRASKSAEMASIMEDLDGETLDIAGQEVFDSLQHEIKEIDGHVGRLRVLEKSQAANAKEVVAQPADSGIVVHAQVKAPKLAPGIQFARFARCMILGKKTGQSPVELAKQEYGERDPHIVQMVQKANVSAVNITTDAALFGNEAGVADYVEFLRSQTIVGKFGTGGIPALRRVPFYFPVVTQATGGTAYWTAEGAGKPMTKPTWTRTELTPLTIAGLAAVTIQALRFSSPDAEMALRDDLTAAVVEAIDTAFIDPANSGTSGAKPASILNGAAGTAVSSGWDGDAIREDARAAMAVFVAAKNPLTTGVWVMSGSNALGILMLVNALGQREFPGMTVNGGTFMGLPVIVSEAAGETVALINASDVWLADEGGVTVDTSGDASLQMLDASVTGTSTGADPVETTLVSMFQTNSVAIRVEKFINWARRRPTGVAFITAATWGVEPATA